MSKISIFFGKLAKWIIANKAKSIIIGSVAAVTIGGTATGVVLLTKHEHTPLSSVVEYYVSATCDAQGSYDEVVYCSECEEEIERTSYTIPALGHDVVNHSAKGPTCTEKGWDAYETCTRCSHSTYAEKAALSHDIVTHDAKAPTCTAIGWDAYETCTRCSHSTYAEKAALNHDIVNHDAKAPTCTEIGWDAYDTCKRTGCGYTTYAEKAALTHDLEHHDAKAPSCTEKGWDAYDTCKRTGCGYTTYAPIKELGHTYKAVITTPTCTKRGYTTHTCHCGDSYTDTYTDALGHTEIVDQAVAATCTATGLTAGKHCPVCNTVLVGQQTIQATGHSYDEWFVSTPATESTAGEKRRECANCDAFETSTVAPLSHDHSRWNSITLPAVAPTCTQTGLTEGKKCSGCQEILIAQETVSATGHSYDEWFVSTPATESAAGEKRRECANCDAFETSTIAPLSHDHSRWDSITLPAVAPTCTETGLTEGKKCSGCQEILIAQETVSATGHSYGEWFVSTPATESAAGEKRRKCANCDAFETSTVAPLSHDHSRWNSITLPAVAPTCTETGLTEGKKCSGCGETLVAQETVKALGHNEIPHDAKAPTCTEIGWDAYVTCSRCDYTTYVPIEETGHLHNAVVTKPTCTEKGYTTHTCHCGDAYVDTYVDALGHKDENTDGYCDACDTVVDVKLAISGTYYSIYREKIVVDTEYFKLDDEEYIVVFTYEISSDVFTATYHSVICEDDELKEELETEYNGVTFTYGFELTKEHFAIIDEDLDAEYYYRSEFLPPCTHYEIREEGKAPTCTEEGYTDYVYCDWCGEVLSEREPLGKINHVYDREIVSDDYKVSDATTESPAIYNKSCSCGAKGEETFTYGDVLTIPLLSVTLNKTEITLAVGATETLIATLNPSNTTEKIKWVSSDESVVKVVNGALIAVGRGNAIVTVETEDYIFAYCTVKVIIPVESVTLDKSEAEIYVGQPFALNAIVLPENADGKTLVWTSSDELVATVNVNGVITAKSAGTTVITATAPNGVSASCTLTVKAGEIKFATDEFGFHYVIGYEGYETDIEIPSMHDGGRVTRIAENAFKNNTLIKSITLPNTIEVIDAYAFYGCTALEAIVIPTSITVINDYTFAECSSLVSVTLNKSTTAIGAYAFANCSSLKNVIFPAKDAKLSTIGSYAFTNCTVLEAVDFSGVAKKLETIGDHAFYYCTALKSVSLADSVKTISESAFERCSALTEIDLGESLVTIANKAFEYCTSLKKIEMPNTVTTLGNYAFRHNDSLTEIVFSDNLVKIGIAAFQSCISIETLILPENIKELGNSAFSYCEGIETLIILGDITNWGDSTFYECTSVEYIYIASKTNSTVRENNYIFYNVGADTEEGLALILGQNAVIPEGLFEPVEDEENYPRIAAIMAEDGSVSFNAFAEKNNLPYLIAISMPDSMESLTYGIFNNSPWWEAQEIGEVYIDNIFYGYKCECYMAHPTDIWVENFVDSDCLNDGSYQNVRDCSVCECEILRKTIVIPAKGHDRLEPVVENYVAPDCITDGAYDSVIYCGRCEAEVEREHIVIDALDHDYIDHEAQPVTCLEIGWDAYQTCGRCDYNTYEEISALGHDYIDHEAQAVTCLEIGWDAYQTCGRCDYTTYEEIAALGHDYIDHEAREETCTEIGWDAYQICGRCDYNSYEEIAALGHDYIDHEAQVPTCTNVGWHEHQTCSRCDYTTYAEIPALGHDYIDHEAKTVTCLEIGWEAYQTCSRCDYSTYVEIPALGHDYIQHEAKEPNCGEIGWNAYDTCSRCNYSTYVELPITGELHSTENGYCSICGLPESTPGLEYSLNSDGKTYTVTGLGSCTEKDIVIGIYNNRNVTNISSYAFEDCSDLTSITIPDSVTSIGEYAFAYCSSLTSITIPDSVTSIGSYAFNGCYRLIEVINKSNLSITAGSSNYGFVGYYAKTVHTGKSKVVKHGDYLYITIADVNYLLAYIEDETELTLPKSYNGNNYAIHNYAFYNCSSLTSITIPDSVTGIGSSAFGGCSALESITLPFVGGNKSATTAGSSTLFGYIFGTSSYTGGVATKQFYFSSNYATYYIPATLKSVTITGGKILSGAFYNCKNLTSITISDSVTSIGGSAFYNCDGLTSVTIPDSVTSIGNEAFGSCSSLTSVTIGNGVTSIGNYAFYQCSSLTSITIPDGVTSIDSGAFDSCTSLISITIPDSVTSIGSYAFYYCSGLTSITIPDGVTNIGNYAFSGCSGLTSITIPDGVTNIGNYAFPGCSGITSITIPDGVTGIGERAFYNCSGLTSVTIGNGVTSIGEYAFGSCSSLTSVTTGNGVTSIGEYAFYNCSSLASITIPDSVTSIGEYAFNGCYRLIEVINKSNLSITAGSSKYGYVGYYAKTVHTGESKVIKHGDYLYITIADVNYLLAYIGDETELTLPESYNGNNYAIHNYAFYNCSDLTSITIPDGVTGIGYSAFEDCSSLTSVTIPDSVTSIGYAAFRNCTNLTSVTIGNSVTSIGSEAFYSCDSLTSVTIGNSVTSIDDYAFEYCYSLTSVHITDIAAWCNISFNDYSSNPLYYANNLYLNGELVTELVIPDSVTRIGNYAFRNCTNLTSVTIPDSVTSIGYDAFFNCSSLTSITILDGVTSIGYEAFYGCYSLTSVHITDIAAWCNISFNGYSSNPLYYAHNLYLNGELVTELVIPDSVTSIGYSAFEYCTSLTSVTIPDSVTSIGSSAFGGCSALESITLPFVGGNKSATSAGSSTVFGYIFGTSSYTGGVATEQYYSSFSRTTYYIPATLKSVTITGGKILYGAFYNCSSLTSVTIGNGVTGIGNYAFSGCSALESITLPFVGSSKSATSAGSSTVFGYIFGTSSYTGGVATEQYYSSSSRTTYYIPATLKSVTITGGKILYGAFYNCSSLTSVTIVNGVTSIGSSAFEGCTSLTSVVIGDGVTSIYDYAFYKCTSLTSVVMGNGVTSIGDEAFYKCTSLTSVVMGNGVTSIGSWAFSGCTSLTSVTIPDSVTSIGYSAFYGCTSLASVTIPDSVTSIGYSAFEGCTSLTSVTIGNSVTSIGSYAFRNCTSLTSVTIPDSVTSIGWYAFSGCDGLTSVVIGNSVTSIGDEAFRYCSSLTSIKYRGTAAQWNAISKGSYWNSNTGSYTITYNYEGE